MRFHRTSITLPFAFFAVLGLTPAIGCGTDSLTGNATGGPPGSSASASPDGGTGPAGSDASDGGGSDVAITAFDIPGIWDVRGQDARGQYTGQVEITKDGSNFKFTRIVQYQGVTVEDQRELWWVWQGEAQGDYRKIALTASLSKLDFVIKRGSLQRDPATDTPVAVTGTFAATGPGQLGGTFSATGIDAKETWSHRVPSGAKPIFTAERTLKDAHDPPSASTKQGLFSTFSSYQSLAPVQPYVNRPDFQAAVHGYYVDHTDFDFYQAHPNALRVVGKVIDDISLAETLLRANAYRYSLTAKAQKFQNDVDTRFMDPQVGMVVDGGPPSGPFQPSGDSALWTGTYVASQAYRYEATFEQKALSNLVTSLDALLKLQEIVAASQGNWSAFARTLRLATGNPTGLWHAGTGPYANLEWLEGGNNDMIKGLLYGYFMGWKTLCGRSGYESYCDRIKTNTKHLAEDVSVGQNDLENNWLAAVVTGTLKYRLKAEEYWIPEKAVMKNNPVHYSQGISDWSGNHLRFVTLTIESLYANEANLGGDAQQAIKDNIDESHANLEKQRFVVWHLLHAAVGSGGGASSPFLDDTKWRMREIPYPKVSFDTDHRINPEFCMSPYPAFPWKNDWTNYPDPDRTGSLREVPYFEYKNDVNLWKSGYEYKGPSNYETPGVEVLHAYWYARKHGLFSAND